VETDLKATRGQKRGLPGKFTAWLTIHASAFHDMGSNDDVSCLDIELELILNKLLIYITYFWMISILETS
jgi:hypothetical protein